ncbi:MAG TPA: L,D-transpeptidase family protein [Chthoniobacterales bacterium]|nr:L,D-transpeptidase family protein [Chthoniobacterales bacterium]
MQRTSSDKCARGARFSADEEVVKQLARFFVFALALLTLSSCSTVSDLVVTHIPQRHTGRPRVVVDLSDQRAYLYRGQHRTAVSRISSGREGYRTPTGRFSVILKDQDHRSSIYGDYVDRDGRVVRANVDVRKHPRPRGAQFVGSPMPFYVCFLPSYGLHAGYLPGVPASHGCIRMPYWKARQFYKTVRIGTPVVVRR